MSIARNTLVQSGLTLGSRILGFARDLALSARFGQGPLMDAWIFHCFCSLRYVGIPNGGRMVL
jgi:peptidoglycan biosynthesis protein MviN/MurJ (putative lipid II flippase)